MQGFFKAGIKNPLAKGQTQTLDDIM